MAMEIRVLAKHGMGVREIAREFGMSRSTVRRYLRDAAAVRYKERLRRSAKIDLQRDALQRAGYGKIFEEKESGRTGTKRPALEAALAYLRPEDHLVIWKVDRLGRSLREMLDTAHKLQSQGVKLRSLTESIDTETPNGRLMFNFLGTIAEYFLDLNRERTMEGLKAALARGRKGGRRRKLMEEDLAVARAMLKNPTFPVAQVAKRMGVSWTTFYAHFPGARANSSTSIGS